MKDPWFNLPTLYAFKGALALGAIVLVLTILTVAAAAAYDRYVVTADCPARIK